MKFYLHNWKTWINLIMVMHAAQSTDNLKKKKSSYVVVISSRLFSPYPKKSLYCTWVFQQ